MKVKFRERGKGEGRGEKGMRGGEKGERGGEKGERGGEEGERGGERERERRGEGRAGPCPPPHSSIRPYDLFQPTYMICRYDNLSRKFFFIKSNIEV